MSDEAPDAERFLALVKRLTEADPHLTPIRAGLLVAAAFNIARDSRTFARKLGVAHAFVLREMNAIAGDGDLLRIDKRDARTMRAHFSLGADMGRYAALLTLGKQAD